MRKCKIMIEGTNENDDTAQVKVSAEGESVDVVTCVADALICAIENYKKEGRSTRALAYMAIERAIKERTSAEVTDIRLPRIKRGEP